RANADKINLANAGPGAVSQLCGSLLQQALGVKFTTIPYQGIGPAMAALLGEQVDVLCDQTTQTIPHIAAGNVKFYGVTTQERISKLPDAPTLEEQGLKGFEVKVWHGIYAPAGTPPAAVSRFNSALKTALKSPAFTGKMADLGAEIVSEDRQTPESLQKWVKSGIDKWTPVLKAEGVDGNGATEGRTGCDTRARRRGGGRPPRRPAAAPGDRPAWECWSPVCRRFAPRPARRNATTGRRRGRRVAGV